MKTHIRIKKLLVQIHVSMYNITLSIMLSTKENRKTANNTLGIIDWWRLYIWLWGFGSDIYLVSFFF